MEFYLSGTTKHKFPSRNWVVHAMLTDPAGPYGFETTDRMSYTSGEYSIRFPETGSHVLVRVPDSDAVEQQRTSKAWVPASHTRGYEIVHMLGIILCAEDVLAGDKERLTERFGLHSNEEAA